MEKEQFESERKIKLHNSRKKLILNLWQFATEFEKTLNFGEVSDFDFEAFVERLNTAKKDFDLKQEQIKLVVKVTPDQLDEVIKSSGLEIQEGEQIKQSFLPFLVQLSDIQEQSTKINFEHPADIDEKIARELRLKTVKIRTGASDLKDSRKKIHLLKGNLEQASYNLIAASCKLAEETFTQVEKAREIAEAKRKAELKAQREIEAQPYAEYLPFGIDLGQLDEAGYNNLLTGAKMQLQAKIDAELKAEQKRIADQKAKDDENGLKLKYQTYENRK
jgi:hypothetical protein